MAAAVLLVSFALQACGKGNAPEPQTLVTVQAEHPETGPISEHILADAILSPLAQAAITPKITAPVKKFYVQRGSRVKAGELLAVLDNRDLKAQALDNQGLYVAAQATYAMQTQAQVPEAYKKAQLDVDQAKAQLDLQTEIVASRKKLLQEGAIPGREYDTSVAALAQAKTNYGVALNTLNSMQKVSHQASLQAAKGTLESAKGKYLAAEAQVDYSEIHSPINGVVTDRPLFAGETASPGVPLITIMDTSALLAKVHLAQTVTQRLSVGDSASVYVPGVDTPVPATVSLISPALDPGSTTVEVWLRVENKAGKFKAGTPVRVSITGRTVSNAIKIPLSAVLTAQDGTKSVMVIGPDSTAKQVPVQLGIHDGEEVQIISDIHPSEMVITTGAYGLDNGTKVKIGNPNTAGSPGGGK
jgi:multidrug efflux pump subunit AcrA (membrane-fusion protein)